MDDTARNRPGRSRSRGIGVGAYVIAAALLAALLGVRAWDPAPVESLRMRVFDTYQQMRPRPPGGAPVLIVDIDEKSMEAEGQWPWPRDLLARLSRRLAAMGAAAHAYDALFAEPDRLSPALLAGRLPGLDAASRAALARQPSNDALFAQALGAGRGVLAQAAQVAAATDSKKSPAVKAALAEIGGDPRPFLLHYGGVVRGLPELERAAPGIGDITFTPEADGTVRRVPLVLNVNGKVAPTLAVEMLRVATGQSAIAIRANAAGIESVVVAGVAIPTDRNGQKWIYFSRPRPDQYVSATDVLAGRVAPRRVAGHLVLIGTSAAGLKDIRHTPVGGGRPGVEVHAQLLENIIGRTGLLRPNFALGAELALILLVGLAVILLTPRIGARATLALGAVLLAALAAASWYFFVSQGVLLDVSYAAAASAILYVVVTFDKYLREEAGRREVRAAFAHYLSPALVDRLADNPDQLTLGGERREMTIMFSDIRGFTAISERTTPEDLTRLVNMILDRLTDATLAHHGTVDKYIGDCMMAFWNAPLEDEDHASHACRAALDIVTAVAALDAELAGVWGPESGPPPKVAVGVGLNTGACLVGNMGSTHRFNYSVLGDPVNLSARLESQTVYYGCPIIIGEETARLAPELAHLELDLIRVKGKQLPVRIFALLGDDTVAGGSAFADLSEAQAALLGAYRAQDWAAALRHLATCRARQGAFPLTRLYDLYEERIAEYMATEPEAGWDGVYVAMEK